MRVGSKEHQMLVPPLSHNGRCYLERSSEASEEPISVSDARKVMTESGVTEQFKKLRGPQGRIFK